MLWIGITGPMGGGKSQVAQILRDMEYIVLDADRVVHDILEKDETVKSSVIKTFGEKILDVQKNLDRRALGRVVFQNASELEKLENILHPRVREVIVQEKQMLSASGNKVAFYDVPLLFEKNMQSQFDQVWVVTAEEPVRRERLKKRSNLKEEEITERFANQLPVAFKINHANRVIKNDSDLEQLRGEVKRALDALKL